MKKLFLGLSLFLGGLLGVISLIAAATICPLNPWDYNGITGWYAVILGMKLQIPLYTSLILTIVGLFVSVKECFNTSEKS